MAKRKDTPRVGGLSIDPAVEQFRDQAARNRAAMTRRQRYDAARVRVRTDLPAILRDALDAIAQEQHTSRNQLAAFLLAWATCQYTEDNPELAELLDAALTPSRNIRVEWDIVLDPLLDRLQQALTNPAEAPPAPSDPDPLGPTMGPTSTPPLGPTLGPTSTPTNGANASPQTVYAHPTYNPPQSAFAVSVGL